MFRVKKSIKKQSRRKIILPTSIILLFSEMVLSVLTEVLNPNLIKLLRSERARFKTSQEFRQKICCTILTLLYNNRILKLWVNGILYDSNSLQINLLLQNIKEIGKKCKSNKVKYIFISSTTYRIYNWNITQWSKWNNRGDLLRK